MTTLEFKNRTGSRPLSPTTRARLQAVENRLASLKKTFDNTIEDVNDHVGMIQGFGFDYLSRDQISMEEFDAEDLCIELEALEKGLRSAINKLAAVVR